MKMVLAKVYKIGISLILSVVVWLTLFSEPSIININVHGLFGSPDIQPILPQLLTDFIVPVNLATSVAFLLIYVFLFNNLHSLRPSVYFSAFCFCLGFLFVICESYHFYDSSKLIIFSSLHFCFALVRSLGYAVLCFVCFHYLDASLKKHIHKYLERKAVFNTYSFIISLLILWSPFLVLNFPGSGAWDFYYMVSQWAGEISWSTHHPVFVTVFYGLCMDAGKSMGDSGIGIFLIVFFNVVICCTSATMLAKLVYSLVPTKITFILLILYFGALPIYPSYVQIAYKDTLSMALVTILTVQLAHFIRKDWKLTNKNFFTLFVVTLGVIFVRNTGIYLVLFCFLGLLMFYWKQVAVRNRIICFFISALVVSKLLLTCAVGYWGISKGSYGEMLSLPLQQTARYLKYYPQDITLEESQLLNKVIDVEKLPKVYNPSLSDPIKGLMKSQDKEDIKNYLIVWWNMFLRHPAVYFSATINHTYDYFFFDGMSKVFGVEIPSYKVGVTSNGPNFGTYEYNFLFSHHIRDFINEYYTKELWRRVPVVGLLYHAGVYCVFLLFALFYALRRKSFRLVLMFMPAIISLLFCLVSPVNGSLRYALPLFSLFPFFVAVCISDRYKQNEDQGSDENT